MKTRKFTAWILAVVMIMSLIPVVTMPVSATTNEVKEIDLTFMQRGTLSSLPNQEKDKGTFKDGDNFIIEKGDTLTLGFANLHGSETSITQADWGLTSINAPTIVGIGTASGSITSMASGTSVLTGNAPGKAEMILTITNTTPVTDAKTIKFNVYVVDNMWDSNWDAPDDVGGSVQLLSIEDSTGGTHTSIPMFIGEKDHEIKINFGNFPSVSRVKLWVSDSSSNIASVRAKNTLINGTSTNPTTISAANEKEMTLRLTPGTNTGRVRVDVELESSIPNIANKAPSRGFFFIRVSRPIEAARLPKPTLAVPNWTAKIDEGKTMISNGTAIATAAGTSSSLSLFYEIADVEASRPDNLTPFDITWEEFASSNTLGDLSDNTLIEAIPGDWIVIYGVDKNDDNKIVSYTSVQVRERDLRNRQELPFINGSDTRVFDLDTPREDIVFSVNFGKTGEGDKSFNGITDIGFASGTGLATITSVNYRVNVREGTLTFNASYLRTLAMQADPYRFEIVFAKDGANDEGKGNNPGNNTVVFIEVVDSSPTYSVKGKVISNVDSFKLEHNRVTVQVVDEHGTIIGDTLTNSIGEYTVANLKPTDPNVAGNLYTVVVRAAGFTEVRGNPAFPLNMQAFNTGTNSTSSKTYDHPDITLTGANEIQPTARPGAENDIISFSDRWGEQKMFINVSAETLELDGFVVAAFSTDGGLKWKNVARNKSFGNAEFVKLLARGVSLQVSDKAIDSKTKKPPANADIVRFQSIAARPKLSKYVINYGVKDGEWALTARGSKTPLTGLEIAGQSLENPKLAGRYSEIGATAAMELQKVRPTADGKSVVFVRVAATMDAAGRIIPASTAKRASVSAFLKAPSLRQTNGVVRVKKGMERLTGGAWAPAIAGGIAGEVTITGNTDFRIAATERRPASTTTTVEFTAAP